MGLFFPQAALQPAVPGPDRCWDGEEMGRDGWSFFSSELVLPCLCFLLFQFGGKEVLQKAIPAVLESSSAPRVRDGQQCVSNWRTLGGLNPVLGCFGAWVAAAGASRGF